MPYRVLSGDIDATAKSQAEMLNLVASLVEKFEVVTLYKFSDSESFRPVEELSGKAQTVSAGLALKDVRADNATQKKSLDIFAQAH